MSDGRTIIIIAVTVIPVTSDDGVVQLVSSPAEEFCEAFLYCDFNISDVVGVQLQLQSDSSPAGWLTLYQFNATANNQSWTTRLKVRCSLSSRIVTIIP